MEEKSEAKPESLLNLDDLLQCPVCYEIPTGQIFQCNEGHHVCGRCKMRLDVCPVCRALFFGTRNYAMEELISNFRKIRSLKLGGKTSAGSGSSASSTPAKDTASEERENDANDDEEENNTNVSERSQGPPQPCSGLFRCLCCKTGNSPRLPAGRLLNHLRYFHAPDLLEGRSENGEYLQAWQFSTVPGKFVTAVRITDMGIFFLTIEITADCVCAWLSMAASPWIAHEFSYTITICGNDREAIFTDFVWSVRSCEGSLRKRGHCLVVKELDARALTAPAAISGKLSVRRTPPDQDVSQTQPRAVLRIANRVSADADSALDVEPFLQELQDDVARLSRAFATLGRETDTLLADTQRTRVAPRASPPAPVSTGRAAPPTPVASGRAARHVPGAAREPPEAPVAAGRAARQAHGAAREPPEASIASDRAARQAPGAARELPEAPGALADFDTLAPHYRRNTRRRLRTHLRAALDTPFVPILHRLRHPDTQPVPPVTPPTQNGYMYSGVVTVAAEPVPPPVASSSVASRPQPQPQTGNANRNKKKRRHRR